jgi:hypothetical protein
VCKQWEWRDNVKINHHHHRHQQHPRRRHAIARGFTTDPALPLPLFLMHWISNTQANTTTTNKENTTITTTHKIPAAEAGLWPPAERSD